MNDVSYFIWVEESIGRGSDDLCRGLSSFPPVITVVGKDDLWDLRSWS